MFIAKGLLFSALRDLCRLIDRNASLPVLQHVLVGASDNVLHLSATDTIMYVRTSVPCEGDALGACLPAKPLADFVRPHDRADEGTVVEFKPAGNDDVAVSYPGATNTFSSLPVADFPALPGDVVARDAWTDGRSWSAGLFASTVDFVIRAVGTDASRRNLTGVYFDRRRVAATDGHRLHVAKLPGLGSGALLVPGKAIGLLLRILPERGRLTVARAGDVLRFKAGAWELDTRLIDEKFPDVGQVIPREGDDRFRLVIEKAPLARALDRLPKPTGRKSSGLTLKVNGQVEMRCETERGVATCTVSVIESTHRGEDLIIGVEAKYLADAIAGAGDKFVARFGGQLDPILVEPAPGKLAVVMPMRV